MCTTSRTPSGSCFVDVRLGHASSTPEERAFGRAFVWLQALCEEDLSGFLTTEWAAASFTTERLGFGLLAARDMGLTPTFTSTLNTSIRQNQIDSRGFVP